MNTHFNTTKESGQTLINFCDKAKSQQEIILEFMKNNPRQAFTPFDILKALFSPNVPVTSIRRAMSNLSEAGLIIKTSMKVLEQYGKVNFKWVYNSNGRN